MPEDTPVQIQDTDEDVKLNTQIDELNKKPDKTSEDNEKLGELKKERSTRYQTKITHAISDKKAADYKAQVAEEKATRLEAELQELKNKPEPISLVNETETYGGKAYYSDTALQRMVDAKQVSEAQAIQMQDERKEAKIEERLSKKFEAKNTADSLKANKEKELAQVFTEHPEWLTTHSKYNPKDPLMLETADLFNAGISPLKALEKAKKIVGKPGRVDNTEHFNVSETSAPDDKGNKTEITWTEDDEYLAVQTFQDVTNPATGRKHTKSECIEKAKKAKQKQLDNKIARKNK